MGLEFSCLSKMKDTSSSTLRKRPRQHIPPPPARRNRKIPPPPPRIRSTTATATNTKIIISSDQTTNSKLSISRNINPKNQTKIKNDHPHIQRLPIHEPTEQTTLSYHKPLQLHPSKPFNSNNLRVPKHHQYHNPNTNDIRKRSISRTLTATAVSAISSAASIISTLSKASSADSPDSTSSRTSTSSHSMNSSSSDSFSSHSSSSTNLTSMSTTTCHADSECMMNGFSPITPESRSICCSQQPPSTQIISPTQTYNLHLHGSDIGDIITDDECHGSIDIEEIHRKYDEQIAVAQMRLNLQHMAKQSNASQISQLSALSQASQISTLSTAPSQISALSSAVVPCNIVVKQAKKVTAGDTVVTPVHSADVVCIAKPRGSPQSAPIRFTPLNKHRDASESHDSSSLWHCPTSDDLDELDSDFEEDHKLNDSDDQSSYFSNHEQSEGTDHVNNRSSFASTISTLSRLTETKLKQKTAKKRIAEQLSMSAQLSSTLTASSSLSSCSSLPQPKSVKIICEDYDMVQHKDIDRKDAGKRKDNMHPITPCSNIMKHSSDSPLPFDHLSLSPEMTARSMKSVSLSINRDDLLTAAYSPAGLSSSGDDSLITSGKLDVEEITKYLQEEDAFDQFECDKYSGQYVD